MLFSVPECPRRRPVEEMRQQVARLRATRALIFPSRRRDGHLEGLGGQAVQIQQERARHARNPVNVKPPSRHLTSKAIRYVQ